MGEQSMSVRESAIAGTWYPAGRDELRRTIEALLEEAGTPEIPGSPLALVCPHAGYTYSGGVAAHSYRAVSGLGFRRVILLGPLHRGGAVGHVIAPSEDAFRTPLGNVAVDHDFLSALGESVSITSVRGDREHSLEIQLPFLQVALGDFRIVPLMLADDVKTPGTQSRIDELARVLADNMDEQSLLVASTDLSHLHSYEEVARIDGQLVDLLGQFDVSGLAAGLRSGRLNACGATGLVSTLSAAERLGATGVEVLAYSSSGDVTGEKSEGQYTVGYVAACAYR